jgi:hypothetical protein
MSKISILQLYKAVLLFFTDLQMWLLREGGEIAQIQFPQVLVPFRRKMDTSKEGRRSIKHLRAGFFCIQFIPILQGESMLLRHFMKAAAPNYYVLRYYH